MTDRDLNPYVGPRTFERQERHLFFGRDWEARDLLSLVISERLVLFYAQSGGGKSSLINTRLIPGLEDKGFEVLPVGRAGGALSSEVQVDNIFVYNLLLSLNQKDGQASPLRDDNMTLKDFLREYESEEPDADGDDQDQEFAIWPRALIIDQFEEILITNLQDWEKRRGFFDQLRQALLDDDYLWVVLSMREDYIAGLEPYAYLLPGKLKARYYMQRMQFDAALAAVRGPVEGRCPFAPGVAERLVNNLRQVRIQEQEKLVIGEYVKPVQLQVVCYQLWENLCDQAGEEITHQDLERLAGGQDLAKFVDKALSQFYEDAITQIVQTVPGLSEFELRDWFETRLITKGRTRDLVYRGGQRTEGIDNAIVSMLEDRFLLRSEARGGRMWYELVHDRLVSPILQANADWRQHHPLIQAALEWKQADVPGSKLYQGAQLEAAFEDPDSAIGLVREFLHAGQQQELEHEQKIRAEEEVKAARRLRGLVVVLAVVSVLAVFAFLMAAMQTRRAQFAQETAVANEQLADARAASESIARLAAIASGATVQAAKATSDANAALAVQNEAEALAAKTMSDANAELALENEAAALAAKKTSDVNEARAISSKATAQAAQRTAEDNLVRAAAEAQVAREQGLEAERQRQIALAQSLAALALQTNNDNELTTLLAVEANHINRKASGSAGWLIDSALGDVLSQRYFNTTFSGHKLGVLSVAFSSDGQWLASASADSTVRLWNVTDPAVQVRVLEGHKDRVWSVAFSPDGRWLASGGDDKIVRLWNMADLDAVPHELDGHGDLVLSVAFSPDGRWLASGSADQTIRLWDVGSLADSPGLATQARVFTGHEDLVRSVAFSPDSQWLASASDDQTVRLWNVLDPAMPAHVFDDYQSAVRSATFSPDGRWLASGSDDGTVRLRDVADPLAPARAFRGHSSRVLAAAFSPDGRQLMTGSADQTVRLWSVWLLSNQDADISSVPTSVLEGHSDTVWSVAFSPDGRWLASGSGDWSVRLWDTTEPEAESDVLGGHGDWVLSASFGPDGQWLASGADDRTVRLWNMTDPSARVRVLSGHTDRIWSVAFSADGRWLASGGDDSIIRIWDMEALDAAPRELGDQAQIFSVAFSPDGRWLASGGSDRVVHLRDMEALQTLYVLGGHEAWIWSVAFSPDGRWLASAGDDETIRLWDVSGLADSPGALMEPRVLGGHTDWVWSVAFDPKGRRLASSSRDSTVRLWKMTTLEELVEIGCNKVRRNLTQEEWRRYLPNEPYRATCLNLPVP